MKRTLLTVISVCMFSFADAQIAKWLIEPENDKLYMANGIDAIIAESGDKKSMWSFGGKKLAETTDDMFEFKENLSVVTQPGTSIISGILKGNGEIMNVGNCNVAHDYPYYSCGKLLVQDGIFNRFVSKDGTKSSNLYIKAYPFFNGYASCQAYTNFEKQKDPYLLLVNENEQGVSFSYNGKSFGSDEIEFISSVNDENIAIVVIKHKLYKFNGRDGSLSPVFAQEDEINLKNQARLEGDISQCYVRTENKNTLLTAKCGKNSIVSFEFDDMLRPISFTVDDVVKRYKFNKEEKRQFTSPLKVTSDSGKYGISWEGKEILPPQFDELSTCFGNKAFVRLNGKYGLLEIDRDASFSLKINKGDDIPFLHQKYETTIRVDMPIYILSDKTYLEIDPVSGLELDKTSREKKNTESGNFVEYNCVLTIPEDLQDETKKVTYPAHVLYNGLKSPVINHRVNAWFYQKFEVEVDESQISVEDGTLTFVFNIKNSRQDASIVKFDVSVSADSLSVQREDKMSETRYKYKVSGLNGGINNVAVQVLEQGCPPAIFTFEVEYHKPVAKTKTTPEEKEKVIIKKKPKATPGEIMEV